MAVFNFNGRNFLLENDNLKEIELLKLDFKCIITFSVQSKLS